MSNYFNDSAFLDNVRHWIDRNILQTNNNLLAEIDELYQKTKIEAEQKGIQEGKVNKPTAGSPLNFEESVSRSFQAAYARTTMALMAYIHQLDARLNAMRQEITKHPYYEKCTNLVDGFSRKKASKLAEIQQLQLKAKEIETNFEIAKTVADRPTGQTNGWPFFLQHSWIFLSILVVLGILDLPFSMASLENLNFSRKETLIVGCAIVMSIALLSHFGGLSLKRYHISRASRNWSFVILILIFGFLSFATVSRYQYASQNEEVLTQPDSTVLDFPEGVIDETSIIDRIRSFNLDSLSDPTFWLFLFMNLLIVSAGIFLSFKVHDSHPEFEKAWQEVQFKSSEYQKSITESSNQINEWNNLVNVQVQSLRNLIDPVLESQMRQYEETLSLRNVLSNHANNIAIQVENKVAEVIEIYRSSNLNNRTAAPLAEWGDPYPFEIAKLAEQENNILKFFKNV